MMERHLFVIRGEEKIHCESCEARIAKALRRLPGVTEAKADRRTQQVEVHFGDGASTPQDVQERLGQLGYIAEPVDAK